MRRVRKPDSWLCSHDTICLRIFSVGAASFGAFSSVSTTCRSILPGLRSCFPPASSRCSTSRTLSASRSTRGGTAREPSGKRGPRWALGGGVFVASVLLTLTPHIAAVATSLAGVCAGFFIVHTAAVGALNRKLAISRGRGNSLYVLFYYLGGTAGITASGQAYDRTGWGGVVVLVVFLLLIPVVAGILEARSDRSHRVFRKSDPD